MSSVWLPGLCKVRIFILAACLMLAGGGLRADSLASEIARLVEQPIAQRAFWGIKVADLDSGDAIYECNPDKLFLPASNAKLFSTALGLTRLGPDYQFTTLVVSTAAPGKDGVVAGDLVLLGGGDPNLSSRVIPYNPNKKFDKDLMLPMSQLARQIFESGVRRVAGNLIGDDTRYVRQDFADGWSLQDTNWGYGAPVGALCFNDNLIEIQVQAGAAAGQAGRLTVRPDIGYYRLDNRIRTAATRTVAQALALDREAGGRSVSLWGEISIRSAGRTFSVAVNDPALFAAMALRAQLAALGVEVTGEVLSRHSWPWEYNSLKRASFAKEPPAGQTVAAIRSARLAESIRVINKESQNLHAEMLLREVGYATRNVGSYEAGLGELEAFLKEAGLDRYEFDFSDASGLSRKDLISPAGTVKLLEQMWKSPYRDQYLDSLPSAGEDGTLDWRFSRTTAKGRLRAKTGTLTHVTALSGYATTEEGRNLAFSIYVNNFGMATAYIRSVVDKIALAITESHRGEGVEIPTGAAATAAPR